MVAVGWTLDELAARVGAALSGAARAGAYPGPPNGRVRDVPDRRSIRWYTTTGLVDRPLAMRGRTAVYGPRHLRQLVAIKRRQAEGLTLAEIQAELVGAGDVRLAAVSGIPDASPLLGEHLDADTVTAGDGPDDPVHGSVVVAGGHLPTAPGPGRRFWAAPPAPVPAAARAELAQPARSPQPPPGPVPSPEPAPRRPSPPSPGPHAPAVPGPAVIGQVPSVRILAQPPGVVPAPETVTTLTGVVLADGVTLLLPAAPPPADLAALLAAAQPLVDLLTARGLTGPAHRRSL